MSNIVKKSVCTNKIVVAVVVHNRSTRVMSIEAFNDAFTA